MQLQSDTFWVPLTLLAIALMLSLLYEEGPK